MSVAIRAEADGEHTRLVPDGTFDLAHASAVLRAVEAAERDLIDSGDVDLHLSELERIDGSGAVLLARLIDRLEARGLRTRLIEDHNPQAARLITLYRERRAADRPQPTRRMSSLDRLGILAAGVPAMVTGALDFLGHAADAVRSMGFDPVSWLVIPRCLALVATLPLLTWIGDVLALGGGLLATMAVTDMTPRAYVLGTADSITGAHFLNGIIKTPFLG